MITENDIAQEVLKGGIAIVIGVGIMLLWISLEDYNFLVSSMIVGFFLSIFWAANVLMGQYNA